MYTLDQPAMVIGMNSRREALEHKLDPQLQVDLAEHLPEHEASVVIDLIPCAGGQTIFPTTVGITAAVTGTAVDMSAGMILTNCIIDIGTVSGTTPSITGQLEESATSTAGGPWTLIPGITTFNVTTQNQEIRLIGQRTLRYARVNITQTSGTTPVVVMSATILAQRNSSPKGTTGFDRSPNAN